MKVTKPTVFQGPEGGGPYQSPNPIDQGNQWAFGGPNPDKFEAKPPRQVEIAGVNPRRFGKGDTNKRF